MRGAFKEGLQGGPSRRAFKKDLKRDLKRVYKRALRGALKSDLEKDSLALQFPFGSFYKPVMHKGRLKKKKKRLTNVKIWGGVGAGPCPKIP